MMSQSITTTNTTTASSSSLRFFHYNECSYEKCKMKNLLKKSRRATTTTTTTTTTAPKIKKQVRFEDDDDDAATITTFNSSFNSLGSTGSDHSNDRWSCDESTKDNSPVMCKPRQSIVMTPVDLPLFEILFELEEEEESEEDSSISSFAEEEQHVAMKKNRRYRTSQRLTKVNKNSRSVATVTN